MKPPVQYAMMPPRVDAPKVGKMKPVVDQPVGDMKPFNLDETLRYYLGPTGIPDKLRAVNSMFNPVEAVGGSMRASQKMLAPDTAPMDRVRYMGDMLSGIGGFVAPMVAAAKVGAPAVAGVVDAFTGLSTAPATQAAKTTATDFMADEFGGFKAYHGSPHDFDKFSLDKIGTGEGAQAYGHGLYFAENEGIARSYRDALSSGRRGVDAPKFKSIKGELKFVQPDDAHDIAEIGVPAIDARLRKIDETIFSKEAENRAFFGDEQTDEMLDLFRKEKDELLALKATGDTSTIKGSMYEVQINADPEKFLDSDLPLNKQPQSVRDALQPVIAGMKDARMNEFDRKAILSGKASGGDLYGALKHSAPGDGAFDRAAAATDAIRSKGIPGIKYLDAGSRTAGDGSRNYVVFDDAMIEILRKYGIAGLMMGGAGMMQPNQAQAGQ